jgi:hypothetical protein
MSAKWNGVHCSLVHEIALVGRVERLHARGRVGIALEVERVRVEQLPRERRRARKVFALIAGMQRQKALQRLDLRAGGHRVVADLHDAARLQIAREKAHDLRARFVRHPRDDAVQRHEIEHRQVDLAVGQFAEAVFEQREIGKLRVVTNGGRRDHVQRVEVACVEVALRMRRRQDQRRKSLPETEFAVGEFALGGRGDALHHERGLEPRRTLFLIVAGRVFDRIVVTRSPAHACSLHRCSSVGVARHVRRAGASALHYARRGRIDE